MGNPIVSRRALLSAAAPLILPRRVFGANDRIRIGVIGAGGRANLLMDQLPPGAEIVALADCYPKRADEAVSRRKVNWRIHYDHRSLLDTKDIDGVIVATADHQRVLCAIHACQAGKDVYAEKPLTLYIAEGRALVKAARRYDRVFQVGSQQRSMAMNRVACEFVRSGGLGKLFFVQGVNYTPPADVPPLAEMPVPEGLNWDLWLNQAPLRPYNSKLHTGWMQWRDYSGGEMTNWGAHGVDQIQWGLGADHTGPVEFWPIPDAEPNAIAYRYASGATVRLEMPPAATSRAAPSSSVRRAASKWYATASAPTLPHSSKRCPRVKRSRSGTGPNGRPSSTCRIGSTPCASAPHQSPMSKSATARYPSAIW